MGKVAVKILLVGVILLIIGGVWYGYLEIDQNQMVVAGMQFDTKSFGLKVRESRQIGYAFLPNDATGRIRWESSDNNIIEVNEITGYVTARKIGNATIKAYDENNNILEQCIVYGLKNEVNLKSIELEENIDLSNGSSYLLTVNPVPNNAVLDGFVYTSSDESIVLVNNQGMITSVGVGSAYVTVTDKKGKISDKVLVNVSQDGKYTTESNTDYTINVEKIKVKKESVEIKVNEIHQIEATVLPENATNKELTYTSVDESIVEVLENGVIKGKKEGKTTIEIRSINNVIKKINVKVSGKTNNNVINVTGIEVSQSEVNLVLGNEIQINTTIKPSNATNKDLKWVSSNEKVATVNKGKIKALKEGSCIITVSANNGVSRKINVKVEKNIIEVVDLAISTDKLEIPVGETASIKTVISPTNATNKNLTWTSSNEKVATVKNGLIKGISVGSCVVKVKTNNGIEKEIKVTIKKIAVIDLILSKESTTIKEGESELITYTVLPTNASESKATWTSNNDNVVSVNNGKLTAKKSGNAVITCKIGNITKKVNVLVTKNEINVSKIEITGNSELKIGTQTKLNVKITPSNATNQKVTWKSSDNSIATINESGVVEGKKVGNVTITAIVDGKSQTHKIKVSAIEVNSISVNQNKVELLENKSININATIVPNNATNKTLIWTSSNPKVATVSSSGIITGIKEGNCIITVKSNNDKKATVSVVVKKVNIPVTNVKLNKTSLNLNIGEASNLIATIEPSNATNKTLTWISSNTKVATVDNNGKITAIGTGTTTITVTTSNNKKETATIQVLNSKNVVTSITLNKADVIIRKGTSETITAIVNPSNATNKTLTWTSSNTQVATVNNNGVIKAVNKGKATITVTSSNGKKAQVIVTVPYEPKKIDSSLYKEKTETLEVHVVKKKGHFLTYIWALNPNKQMKKYVAPATATTGIKPTELLKQAINEDKLKNKLVLASNATVIGIKDSYYGEFYKCEYNGKYAWYGKATANKVDEPASLQIINGKVTRFAPGGENCVKNTTIYYIDKNNQLSYIPPAKPEYGYDTIEKKANLYKSVIDAGAYNTFSFEPILIYDGKIMKKEIKKTSSYSASRQAFCQLNDNNFILITSNELGSTSCAETSECKDWNLDKFADYLLELGCKTAVNFDGGGSTTLMFKKSTKDKATLLTQNGNASKQRSNSSIMYFTELN